MKKLINAPQSVVPEMLEGLVLLYPGLDCVPGQPVLIRSDAADVCQQQVALISGGGSGHEPAHAGYVGQGMLSAAVAGDVFTSPGPDAVFAALQATAGAPGALLIVKNYTGDRLNFGLAAERFRAQGNAVEMVIVADDAALADSTDHAGRRGLAGTILVHKIAGAAAEAGASLAQVAAEARAAAAAVRTIGVALTPCIVPAAGKPGFSLAPDEIELGLGIHGESGVRRETLRSADRLVDELLEPLVADLRLRSGERVVVLVNNLGATPTMELAIVARRALTELERREIIVERAYAGTFLSALEMAGVSLSLMRVDDQRLSRLDALTTAPAWPNAAAQPHRPLRTASATLAETSPPLSTHHPTTHSGRLLKQILTAVFETLIGTADQLTELDREVGDGDMGISLARGAQAMLTRLPMIDVDDPAQTFYELGCTLQQTMGGTSGALYSVFLLRASRLLHEENQGLAAWVGAVRGATEAIREFGGAEPGDRTMLDALLPAIAALQTGLEQGLTATQALNQAARAATQGAEATQTMSPRRGRSSYVGDRVRGFQDPGAVAVAVWFGVIASELRQLS